MSSDSSMIGPLKKCALYFIIVVVKGVPRKSRFLFCKYRLTDNSTNSQFFVLK